MTKARKIASDVAFTPSVKAIQSRKGSRSAYARMESGAGWATTITIDLATFISRQTSVFLATADSTGQPYIQHRGGPPGFLHVLDENTIAFADFRGNQQFISAGNLAENAKAHLFLIDYSTRQRIKIWGKARVVEEDVALIARLMPPNYKARSDQAILFHVDTWDANCPQHIPQRFEAADVARSLAERDQRIVELEAEIARLRRMLE
ncbi:MAG TPA: pyridoxamine 5'-phosphate oxidase family protein [Accumulibacter sp.]|uniref:pyridoxamine 5'-phosphate oxidase family protein n=1 Tax=Accumulibacter sp. TaxID=2053492 RepID=UPI0025D902F0|nr:pyridoxamine 5'-phosphate oxidase family protein [Accumulibacter sp.]MCM8597985.1 pyridoxamine 5'-phosphate oxidase family protein [Accumulibacter sp.]HMW77075.1 pyridoxamine 5'-phosphate oxidase family protein [Rhodocyclaceae bacterium]HNF92171.1 pyridoxamine 5'-phosphate oxidase family protein [Accumulibacter sp.]